LKIIFFAPHAATWIHAFPEALVADALAQAGHEVVYVTCNGIFDDSCLAMGARGIGWESADADKKAVCAICKANKGMLRKEFNLRGYDLDTFVQPEDLPEIERIVDTATPNDLFSTRHNDIDVARYAVYSLLIRHKKTGLEFSTDEWNEYRGQLRNALYASVACRRILEQERPDAVVVYNSVYAVNRVCVELAEARGIATYSLHAGGNLSNRLQTLMLGRHHWLRFAEHLVALWRSQRDRPCRPEELAAVTDHVIALFGAQSPFVYSAPTSRRQVVNAREIFQVDPNQRLLMATMSSYDELYAGQVVGIGSGEDGLAFRSQIEWIKELVSWIATRPEHFLIVRVHPREFPNRREARKSAHAAELEQALAQLPANVKINWPDDRLSLYDLAEEVDVILNAWSSAGKEMALLGLPVVVYSPGLLAYPPELNYVGVTREAYFQQIERAVRDGWSMDRVRDAYRWHALELCTALINISDGYGRQESGRRTFGLRRILDATRRRLIPQFDERADCRRRARRLRNAGLINQVFVSRAESILDVNEQWAKSGASAEEEHRNLQIELRRLMQARYSEVSPAASGRPLRTKLFEACTK